MDVLLLGRCPRRCTATPRCCDFPSAPHRVCTAPLRLPLGSSPSMHGSSPRLPFSSSLSCNPAHTAQQVITATDQSLTSCAPSVNSLHHRHCTLSRTQTPILSPDPVARRSNAIHSFHRGPSCPPSHLPKRLHRTCLLQITDLLQRHRTHQPSFLSLDSLSSSLNCVYHKRMRGPLL